jgi:hypothetical protein
MEAQYGFVCLGDTRLVYLGGGLMLVFLYSIVLCSKPVDKLTNFVLPSVTKNFSMFNTLMALNPQYLNVNVGQPK